MESSATVAKISDKLHHVFELVAARHGREAIRLLKQLRDDCPASLDGGQPDLLARILLCFVTGAVGWWAAAWTDDQCGWDLAQELIAGAETEAAAVGRPVADVAADIGWVLTLAAETAWIYANSPRADADSLANVWTELTELSKILPESLAAGVAYTHVPGWDANGLALTSTRFASHEYEPEAASLYARSLFGNSSGFTHAQLNLRDDTVTMVAMDVAAHVARISPARVRPPPALVRYAQLAAGPAGSSADEIADRLAASDGRESVAALVACGCQGAPGEYQARLLRVLAAGRIRPADALAVIIALQFNPAAKFPPAFFDEVVPVLAELFAAVDRPRAPGLTTLDLPPVIV
jgi:hypothetical protein